MRFNHYDNNINHISSHQIIQEKIRLWSIYKRNYENIK